jgi:N-acyl-D-amino-acid deacylase
MDRNLDVIHSMITHPGVIVGGSDGGAHVRFICDAALPTFALVHWVRDRTRGARIPLESMVHKLTLEPASLYGFDDRGVIAPGKRADINVIDLEGLRLAPPRPVHDLPGKGLRLLQDSQGYAATLVNGVITRRNDRDTGARPGRLLRRRKDASENRPAALAEA